MEVDISKKVTYFVKFGLVGLIALALLCSAGVWFYQHRNTHMKVYDAQVTSTMVGVKTKANGKIAEIKVEDGDHVEAGTVLARIEVSVTEEQIQQLQQNLELAQRNLAEIQKGQTITVPMPSVESVGSSNAAAQVELERAASRLQRMNELFEMGAISAVKRDEAAAEYAAAQAAAAAVPSAPPSVSYQTMVQPSSPEVIKNAEIQVRQAEAALENAKKDSQATEIVAPVAGTVYLAELAENNEVTAGQTIMNIGDAGNIWVEARVTPEQKSKIRLGQFAEYTIEGRKFQGTVQEIETDDDENAEGMANTEGRAPTEDDGKFFVKISLPTEAALELKPGMKTVVEFAVDN
ncbi:MAG: efflux RND transporter periplasmic adaptor subunit [Selenomonadaceae bacterium]|nr:efflux RND transporter periplasmic adaptor subunit [Selenomonadaceae bacterium]MBQ1915623.1 efflux RND transporter periplasmic adaptor subunit [Selenomonadaceae bacterium]